MHQREIMKMIIDKIKKTRRKENSKEMWNYKKKSLKRMPIEENLKAKTWYFKNANNYIN